MKTEAAMRAFFGVTYFIALGLIIWGVGQLTCYSLLPPGNRSVSLWVRAIAWLVQFICLAVWFGRGASALQKITKNTTWGYFWYVFIRAFTLPIVLLLVVIIVDDSFFSGTFLSWHMVYTVQHLCIALIILVILLLRSLWRRSEWGMLYRGH